MKLSFLTLTLFVFSQYCFAQNNTLPKFNNDTLYTTSGYTITQGQEIKLGTGTRDNGDFKYITTVKSFLAMPNQHMPSLRKSANRHSATVKKIKKEGSEKNGYVYNVILGIGEPVNYECDVENAIASGEIIVPDKYKNQNKTNSSQPVSIADEIAKLKKLYDDSVITKEEFEAQKKKLLEENQ